MARRICEVQDCNNVHYGLGYCAMHYQRVRMRGTTDRHDWRRPPIERFAQLTERGDDCWQWLGTINPRGYGLFFDGERMVAAHRWAYEHFIGPIPAGLYIDHLCHQNCAGGNGCLHRSCVNPAHMEPVTNRTNVVRGMAARGDSAIKRGEAVGNSILRESDIPAIRTASAAGESGRSIARRYGVHATTIYHVLSGKSWAHVR